MNKIDYDFNGIDAKTSRPFSGGHPDGVWFIAIIYGLLVGLTIISILGVFMTLMSQKTFEAVTFLQALLNLTLFAPMLFLLFKRSSHVLKLSLLTLAVNVVLLIFYGYFKQEEAMVAAITIVFQAAISLYFRGLIKDNLMTE